jgi:hypothetical protein
MRPMIAISMGLAILLVASFCGCSSSSQPPFPDSPSSSGTSSGGGLGGSGSSGGSSGANSSGSSGGGLITGDGGTGVLPTGDGSVTVTTTIYAHTDDTLYSVDPQTKAVTVVGPFAGTSDASTDSAVTDLAVDANGDVYVNTESAVYKAALPATFPGTVALTKVATIQGTSRFYALAFAPAGALDAASETLVGGDSDGRLWSISTTTGATVNLGNFGADKSVAGNTFELSGDVVFYVDSTHGPTGLATIRSCPAGGSGTQCSKDYLAGVDMSALKTAYTSGTAASSLLAGIYGGSSAGPGNGTGYADVFGLGAWDSTVFGFSRHVGSGSSAVAPTLITIDTASGVGTMIANNFSFTNGWSGAGVTTKVTISVPTPPPPPLQ